MGTLGTDWAINNQNQSLTIRLTKSRLQWFLKVYVIKRRPIYKNSNLPFVSGCVNDRLVIHDCISFAVYFKTTNSGTAWNGFLRRQSKLLADLKSK